MRDGIYNLGVLHIVLCAFAMVVLFLLAFRIEAKLDRIGSPCKSASSEERPR